MKRIVIYSNCMFSYTTMQTVLCDIYSVACITKANSELYFFDTDFVVFIINECNLLQYSEFFIKNCRHLPYEKFVIIGESEYCKLFNAIVGCQYKNIDITLPIKELRVQSKELILEDRSKLPVGMAKNAITPIEIEVIQMISNGFSLTQIAILKERSLKTISHHKCNFFRKLGLKNRTVNLLKLVDGKKKLILDL